MANVIKKAQANHDTGTEYQILHYETQLEQVKVLNDSGSAVSNLKEMLFDGKVTTGISVDTLVESGMYRIKGCADIPSFTTTTETYLLEVFKINVSDSVKVIRQDFYDHQNANQYQRYIVNGAKKPWVGMGKITENDISTIKSKVSGLEDGLATLSTKISGNSTSITNINKDITALETSMTTHNHDTRYLKLSGGAVTNNITMANDKSFSGKNTSGNMVNLAKVTSGNNVDIGDPSLPLSLHAKEGKAKVWDGVSTYYLFHTGNMGSGSGLDADKIDGIDGSQLARRDAVNYFKANQFVDDGKSLYFKADSGSGSGNIYWQKSDGSEMAKIVTSVNGDINLYGGGGSLLGLSVRADGHTETTHDHILNAKDRQVSVRFVLDSGDKGAGFYMNNTTKQVGFYDWEHGGVIFRTDREDQTVKFENEIFIQGHKLSIQGSAPSSPKTGDVWIDI